MKSFSSLAVLWASMLLFYPFYSSAQESVGIGTDFPDSHASLEVESINKGVLISRMTTAQRNGIAGLGAAQEGLLIYNRSDDQFNYWDGTQWLAFPGGDEDWYEDGTPPGPPDNIADAIFTNGSVGIGINVPAQTFHIADINNALQTIRVQDLSQTGDGYNPGTGTVSLTNRATVFVDKTTGVMYSEDADRAFWRLDGNSNVVNAGYSGSCPNLISGSMNASGYEYIGTNDNTDFIIATNDRERMRILRDGQLVAYGKGTGTPASSPTGCVPAYPVIDAASFYGTANTYPLNAYSENVPAVYGVAQGTGQPAGVAGAINGAGYGVWGYVDLNTTASVGVFGEDVSLLGWAMYADGDMNCSNLYYNISDKKLKQNIQDYSDGLSAIMQLKPKTYDIRQEYHDYGLSRNENIGFIAQEVQQVLPHLVKSSFIPAPHAPKGKPEERKPDVDNVMAVSYVGMIPVMTAAIQEQQYVIEDLMRENAEMKERLRVIEEQLFTPPPGVE